ncbi:MAG: DUF2330 domain-containing protein [Candidatus Kuenenbacteria bacterium]
MIKKLFCILLLTFIISSPLVVFADGMMIAPPDRYIWETDQKAVIFHKNGMETLVLSVTFSGNAEDFAWIVPTASRPEVSKSSDELFTSLDELTRIMPDYPKSTGLGHMNRADVMEQGVVVIETKQVEYYDISVLAADDSKALVQWLNENGYEYPEEGRYILQSYIDNNWYFTAIKVIDEYAALNVERQFRDGHAIPLRLDFKTEKIVYPLKISSVVAGNSLKGRPIIDYEYMDEGLVEDSEGIAVPVPAPERAPVDYYYDESMGILLYVITDNKQTLPKFDTLYASWIDKDTIEDLAYDDEGNAWMKVGQDKYFLTKLYRRMTRAQMTNDLFLRQADDNEAVNALQEKEKGWAGFIWVVSIGGLLFLALFGILTVYGVKKEQGQ